MGQIVKLKYKIFYFVCISLVILISGCKESVSPPSLRLTTPKQTDLQNSSFYNFIEKLKKSPIDSRNAVLQKYLENNAHSPVIGNNQLACFYFIGDTSKVLINGDIQNAWSLPDTMNSISIGDSSFYYKIYLLPPDGRFDYTFNINGKTILDPRNPYTTPSGYGLHSSFSMPEFKEDSSRIFRAGIHHGTFDSLFITSKLTAVQPRMIKIYKPAGYDTLANIPVLIMNDGFKAIKYCSYPIILDNLIADNKIKPVLVVFIDYKEEDANYEIDRTNEYIKFICDDILPIIENKYKISRQPENHVIAGVSAGASISILTVFKRPDKFLKAAGQSTTITEKIWNALGNKKDLQNFKSYKFYFDVGRFDLLSGAAYNYPFLYANQKINKRMNELGIKHSFHIYNDGHEWANWRERVDDILIYFFRR